MNDVHETYKGDKFYQYIWSLFNKISLQRYDIFILFANTLQLYPFQHVLWVVESPLKYRSMLVRYFDVILLSNVISFIGTKILDCDTKDLTYIGVAKFVIL